MLLYRTVKGDISVPRTLYVYNCMKINSKIHFIIKQNVMHMSMLTTNLKRIIKNINKNDTEH